MEKENNPIAERDENGNLMYMDIVPMTYIKFCNSWEFLFKIKTPIKFNISLLNKHTVPTV